METFKYIMDYIVVPVVLPACALMIGWLIKLEKRTLKVKDMEKKIIDIENKYQSLAVTLDKINTSLQINKTMLKSNQDSLKQITEYYINQGLKSNVKAN